jgi:ABC-2 type transport system permease protein
MSGAFPTMLVASIKAYYRNPQAMFFSVIFPLVIMVIFGLLNLGGTTKVDVGVVDLAKSATSTRFVDSLKKIEAVNLHQGSQDAEVAALDKGDRDLVVVLPADMGQAEPPAPCPPRTVCRPAARPTIKPATITAYLNQARPAQSQVARAILEQLAGQASFGAAGITPAFSVDAKPLTGRNVTYVDFLVPGVIALSIMQTGIFSLAFALVRQKESGILRRLIATPMKKPDFLAAQVITRMIMALVQLVMLLLVAVLFLHFTLAGNVVYLVLAAALGSVIFIALGFAVAGVSKNEDSVPALANIIVLPMMFLSGVFFPVNNVPAWLRVISDRLPLTYLADALRSIANDGASLWTSNVRWDLLWMAVWVVVMVILAVRIFRWENTG